MTLLSGPPNTADAISAGSVAAIFFNWLPQVTALLAAVWFILRIGIAIQEWRINGRKLSALKRLYDQTLAEPIPPDMLDKLDKLK